MGQLGATMDQLGATMGQLGATMGQLGATMHIGPEMVNIRKFFSPVLFFAEKNFPEFSNISKCSSCIFLNIIKTYFIQQNSENRDKTFQKLCPDIDRFWPNVRWTDGPMNQRTNGPADGRIYPLIQIVNARWEQRRHSNLLWSNDF